jgi:hypothetical protein
VETAKSGQLTARPPVENAERSRSGVGFLDIAHC